MALGQQAGTIESRVDRRDDVHHRTRGTDASGRAHTLTLVNISRGGLMARCADGFTPGDRLRITMPMVGPVEAEVRWALGGRIGGQFTTPLAPATYDAVLAATGRG